MAAPAYQTFKRQVNLPVGEHLAFAAGHGYYAKPGAGAAAPAAAPVDPYGGIIAGIPKPLTNAQITTQAQGQISPLVAAITKTIGDQTAAATHAIGGYTSDAAAKLGAIDFGAPYAQGQQGQAAVDAALRQSLAGAGSAGADDLAKRLSVINDPTVGAAAGALAANGAANGTTQVAQGSASLGNLIADAASASSYGQKQPGITRLAGIQNIAAAGQAGQAQIAAQAQALEAQLPSIIQNLQARNDARNQQITAARENQIARGDAIASGAAANDARFAIADANNATRAQIAAIQAEGKASAASQAQANSDRTYRLQFSKTFGFDPVTNATLPGYRRDASGSVVKVSTPKPAKGPALTAKQVQDYKGTAATVANNSRTGFTDSKNVQHPALSAYDALKEMRQEGIPDGIAVAAINRSYNTNFNPKGKLP